VPDELSFDGSLDRLTTSLSGMSFELLGRTISARGMSDVNWNAWLVVPTEISAVTSYSGERLRTASDLKMEQLFDAVALRGHGEMR
jgi:hypothetical protein